MCSDAMRALRWAGCANLDQMLLACNYLQVRCARCAVLCQHAAAWALAKAAAPFRTLRETFTKSGACMHGK